MKDDLSARTGHNYTWYKITHYIDLYYNHTIDVMQRKFLSHYSIWWMKGEGGRKDWENILLLA